MAETKLANNQLAEGTKISNYKVYNGLYGLGVGGPNLQAHVTVNSQWKYEDYDTWQFTYHFKTPGRWSCGQTGSTAWMPIFEDGVSTGGIRMGIRSDGKVELLLSGTGIYYAPVDSYPYFSLSLNTHYYFKITYDSTKYVIEYANDEDFTIGYQSYTHNISTKVTNPDSTHDFGWYRRNIGMTGYTGELVWYFDDFKFVANGDQVIFDGSDSSYYTTTGNPGIEVTTTGYTQITNCNVTVIESFKQGDSWYRIWSDGFCEQGGVVGATPTNIIFLKSYKDLDYIVVGTEFQDDDNCRTIKINTSNRTVNSIRVTSSATPIHVAWYSRGYVNLGE